MKEKYYIGLDMGTSSVGWAVTDPSYKILRRKGKDMWGVRLFPEASTSAERRAHRISRRRLQREKARINLLRELLHPAIESIDPGFYQRLEDSKFWMEDKKEQQPYALFCDDHFTDKEYYATFPTIFHLRKELIESKEPHDIRLIYLAILNIFKHRGHFLNTNLDDKGTEDIRQILESLNDNFALWREDHFAEPEKLNEIASILTARDSSATYRCEKLGICLGISKTKDKDRYEMLKLICGLSGSLSILFLEGKGDEESKKIKISFQSSEFDEMMSKIESLIDETCYEILLDLKRIYDWSALANIMSGEGVHYISDARIQSYEKHKYDLQCLKQVYKTYLPCLYDSMFRVMQDGNYSAYVGSVNSDKEYKRRGGKNKKDDLINRIKKDFQSLCRSKEVDYILNEIEKGTFLPKQLTSDNGIIPYQLHKAELVRILDNASKYIPLLNDVDESGKTVAERIIMLFEYNIPYFVGPLRHTQNGTGWSVVEGTGRITPWNIENRIDFAKSEEKFIARMVRHCTYLAGELVLPRESLLYQKYCVLNELNNLRIDGEKISVKLKQSIYNDLFRRGKKVKGKDLQRYFVREGLIASDQEIVLSGIDGDFVNTLSSYKKFAEALGVEILTYEQEQMAEVIIQWVTIHAGSKKLIRERMKENYGHILTKEQINRIAGYKFKDWGNLSREFLQTTEKFGESTIIDRLWDTNSNLMELLSSNFGYLEAIEEKTENHSRILSDIEYEDLDGLYLSTPVKRMVWQTILVLKEITDIMGSEPAKVFIEMARGDGEKNKRTQSRQKKLEELYKACKKEEPILFEKIKNESDARLRIKKLYLYYSQKGRCMYTGDVIEINDLMNDNLYDIDHVYPRHFRKDDSLEDNLVLVKKHLNNRKQDTFPIEADIRHKMSSWWKSLYEGGFITKTKYERLIRNHGFSMEEKAEFIQRQLVETRQGTKVIAKLMEELFVDSQVIYVKASTVSQFRQQKDMLKVRVLNDLHHAHDAYLNIVVGNVYHVKFTKDPMNFVREYERNPKANAYHLEHMFDYDVRRGEESAWVIKEESSIATVRRMIRRGTPLVTYMNYEAHGGITKKDTIYGKRKALEGVYLPTGKNDSRLTSVTEDGFLKYGGRSDILGTYFFLVEHTEKKKRIRTLEPMYLHMVSQFKTKEDIERYCREKLGYIEPSVRISRIKMYSKISVNGYDLLLTGRSGNQLAVSNAMQLKLKSECGAYVKNVHTAMENSYGAEQLERIGISKERNLTIYDVLIEKHVNGIFHKKPNPIGEKLCKHRSSFMRLDVLMQCKIILEIIKATGKENNGADLKEFGESVTSGKMTLNKKLSNYENIQLINQSVTGLYESRVNLLTI